MTHGRPEHDSAISRSQFHSFPELHSKTERVIMIAIVFFLALATAQDSCTITTEQWQPIKGNAPPAAKPASAPAKVDWPSPLSMKPAAESPTTTASLTLNQGAQLGLNLDLDESDMQQKFVNFLKESTTEQIVELRRRLDPNLPSIARRLDPKIMDAVELALKLKLGDRKPRSIKVISDIDDTAFASLNDKSFPRGDLYPGMAAFAMAFNPQLGMDEAIAFLSARPAGTLDLLRMWTQHSLNSKGLINVTVIAADELTFSHAKMAEGKLKSYVTYKRFYPDYDFVLVGDSGQGDIEFMKKALALPEPQVALALIHDVVNRDNEPKTSPEKRKELRGKRIHIFDNYLEAAIEAVESGLVKAEQLGKVRDQFMAELDQVKFKKEAFRNKRKEEAKKASDRAQALIHPKPK